MAGSTVCDLMKKISHFEFLGMLYLLKNILPSPAGLSRKAQPFQNFTFN